MQDTKEKITDAVETAVQVIVGILVGLLISVAILSSAYLDYEAYRQRFPHAQPWTYFFQGH